ncbi:MAG: FAD-binding protein, partial [Comamonadaceae bacterium]
MDKISQDLERAAAASIPGQAGFDYLIVGAGFAGSVLAERLARGLGKRVLMVEKRPHVGGNAYDRYDDAGVLIHP